MFLIWTGVKIGNCSPLPFYAKKKWFQPLKDFDLKFYFDLGYFQTFGQMNFWYRHRSVSDGQLWSGRCTWFSWKLTSVFLNCRSLNIRTFYFETSVHFWIWLRSFSTRIVNSRPGGTCRSVSPKYGPENSLRTVHLRPKTTKNGILKILKPPQNWLVTISIEITQHTKWQSFCTNRVQIVRIKVFRVSPDSLWQFHSRFTPNKTVLETTIFVLHHFSRECTKIWGHVLYSIKSYL